MSRHPLMSDVHYTKQEMESFLSGYKAVIDRKTELITELVEIIESAIKSRDWIVDGACDPDYILKLAKKAAKDKS